MQMSGIKGNGSSPSLLPPQPKSPPELYGRRRELAKVQVLEREIGFLEEELKSIEGLQLASRSCKEVADFVTVNADPLVTTAKNVRSSCRFWKWLCGGISCFKVSWICRCCWPSSMSSICGSDTCHSCGNSCTGCCRLPTCCCGCLSSSCRDCKCFEKSKCSMNCCSSCTTCSFCCTCYPKCLNLKTICSCCQKSCCYPCYFCY